MKYTIINASVREAVKIAPSAEIIFRHGDVVRAFDTISEFDTWKSKQTLSSLSKIKKINKKREGEWEVEKVQYHA